MAGYGSDAGFQQWLADNGYERPSDARTDAALRQRASTYIDGLYSARFRGAPAGGIAQERAWPRTGAVVHRELIAADIVPTAIELATYAAAYQESLAPGSLAAFLRAADQVKRERVGPIDIEYRDIGSDAVGAATPVLTEVEGLLAAFLLPADAAPSLSLLAIG